MLGYLGRMGRVIFTRNHSFLNKCLKNGEYYDLTSAYWDRLQPIKAIVTESDPTVTCIWTITAVRGKSDESVETLRPAANTPSIGVLVN